MAEQENSGTPGERLARLEERVHNSASALQSQIAASHTEILGRITGLDTKITRQNGRLDRVEEWQEKRVRELEHERGVLEGKTSSFSMLDKALVRLVALGGGLLTLYEGIKELWLK